VPEAQSPLSVVIPAREGIVEIAPVLAGLEEEAREAGVEVIVVGPASGGAAPEWVRLIEMDDPSMLALRRRAVLAARGEIVAIGEDHAVPRPGWCRDVIRAHAEHPEAAVVIGCLVNATDDTVAGRANFLAFAAAWQPPMPELPSRRPGPSSTMTFKRSAYEGLEEQPVGWFEATLIPTLFLAGRMVADDRIVVDHYQDHGAVWSVINAYDSARSSYGSDRPRLSPAERRRVARWAAAEIPKGLWREARAGAGTKGMSAPVAALVATIVSAAGLGAVLGCLVGPGRSAERVA